MKKLFAIWLIMTMVLIGCDAAPTTNASKNDYDAIEDDYSVYLLDENLNWGMKEGELTQTLGDTPWDKNDNNTVYIMYNKSSYTSVLDEFKISYTTYGFTEKNELFYVSYVIEQKHGLDSLYGDMYERFDEINSYFTGLYGEPEQNEMIWSDERYKEDRGSWNKAFNNLDVSAVASWNHDNITTSLIYVGSELYVRHQDKSLSDIDTPLSI